MSTIFKEIKLQNWRQYKNVEIILDTEMTVLTGENGTGKTTLLNTLSRHFGWNLSLISTPFHLSLSKKKTQEMWSDFHQMIEDDLSVNASDCAVGTITYDNGLICKLAAPSKVGQAQYNLKYANQQEVLGLHIPSHQPAFAYSRVQNIPIDPKTSQQHYSDYQTLLQQLYQSGHSNNPGVRLKESLIALAVFGYGNQAVVGNIAYERMFEDFQRILEILLPKNLGFTKLQIRMPDIVLVTKTGDFSLDAASGGIGALIGIAWQIFMYGQEKHNFVVTIDEPESHLHPSMQRELLPNLNTAFPNTQFIIATHSPFIVTSAPHAKVYALIQNEDRGIDSVHLDTADLSGTANETLRSILGVPMTIPIWVENKLNEITDKYRRLEINEDNLNKLKNELKENNLTTLLPESISKIGKLNA
ncbi:hypothetical protein DGWBC_0385 [Dehalogenimonas sp. WBC-2]|nr:hypothetical protein DGWBC_0385 [Dehalogenimonas sp. WBC-2]